MMLDNQFPGAGLLLFKIKMWSNKHARPESDSRVLTTRMHSELENVRMSVEFLSCF